MKSPKSTKLTESEPKPFRRLNMKSARNRLAESEKYHIDKMIDAWNDRIPDEYIGHTIHDIESGWNDSLDAASKVKLMQYVNSGADSRFLVLQGGAGVGKSTLAVTIATHLLQERGIIPEYRLTPILLQDFSFGFHDGINHLEVLSRVPLLILDDLGAGNASMSEHQQRNMWALIDQRWSNKRLKTIITTNMATTGSRSSGTGMREWLGETSWDRVSHDMLRIMLGGESMRNNILDAGRFDHL